MEDLQGPLNLTGRTGLAQSAGIIANAEGLIGNDSAMAHLAAACGIPTTVVCGPTDAEITAPPGAWVRVVHKKGLDCLPCGRMDCRTAGHPCMQALEAERILSALEEAMTIVQNPASPQAPGHP
jgi:ADP-heptose:LPS heptosyltransferase